MKTNNPKIITSDKHWGSLARGYLHLAQIGLKYYVDKPRLGKEKLGSHPKIKIPLRYGLRDGNAIIACIWNIKHALEIILKGIGISVDKKYWAEHDLIFLLNDVENKLTVYGLDKNINLLKSLVDKYYNCKFTPKTIFLDKDNTYFKYPEIKGGFALDYSFVHDLSRKDINQFLKDINNIKVLSTILSNTPIVLMIKKAHPKAIVTKYTLKKLGYKK